MTSPQQEHGLLIEFWPLCQTVLPGFRGSLAALASAGNNLIGDDVLLEPRWPREAVEALASHEVCVVGVHCPVDSAEERERARGDRIVGTARGQHNQAHTQGIYDVEMDTTILTPESCAKRILETQQRSPRPCAFEPLRSNDDTQQNGCYFIENTAPWRAISVIPLRR
jgi:chloramphenicol 3-O-phosphotransferase